MVAVGGKKGWLYWRKAVGGRKELSRKVRGLARDIGDSEAHRSWAKP